LLRHEFFLPTPLLFFFKFLFASFGLLSGFLSDNLVLVDWTSLLKHTLNELSLTILYDLSSFCVRFSHAPDSIIHGLISLLLDLNSFQVLQLVAMDYMLDHHLPFPQRNLLLRVVVFILKHLGFSKACEQQFFDFL
jgi:hypothetical protein